MSSKERREEEALLELPAPVPAPPWCTGVGGAETVVAEDATAAAAAAAETDAEAEGSRRTVMAPRAGERSIDAVVAVVFAVFAVVVAIVVVEDDLLGAPPSCPRIRSRTLGRHQILFVSHRTINSTCQNVHPPRSLSLSLLRSIGLSDLRGISRKDRENEMRESLAR